MSKKLCIYHANCADGFTAAWVVRNAVERCDFVPASYGDAPPDVTGKDVYIVDFSYKRDVLIEMAESAKSIVVLDHHKTAQEELADLIDEGPENLDVVFDMERSGAMMAWEYLHPGTKAPPLVHYVQDRDLWFFNLHRSREINAVVGSMPMRFSYWDSVANQIRYNLEATVREGEAILRAHDKMVDQVINTTTRLMRIGGYIVPVANGPYALASDVAGKLADGEPFAASYVDTPDGRAFSLRSRNDGEDVSKIAKAYGGGGHRNAAGFKVRTGWEGEELP